MALESVVSTKGIATATLVVGCLAIFCYQWLGMDTRLHPLPASGGLHSRESVSVLPCCHPLHFSKELNALYFLALCDRLHGPAPAAGPTAAARPLRDAEQLPDAGAWWSPGVAEWCLQQIRSECGLQLDEPTLERHRRVARRNATVAGAVDAGGDLTRCLELRYGIRRQDVRPARLPPLRLTSRPAPAATYSKERRVPPSDVGPAEPGAIPQAALNAHMHMSQQHAAAGKGKVPRRTLDRVARPGPMPGSRPSPGGPGAMVQPQPKGAGPLSIIMPLYSIAIIIFFCYTVVKVVTKRSAAKEQRRQSRGFSSTDGAAGGPRSSLKPTVAPSDAATPDNYRRYKLEGKRVSYAQPPVTAAAGAKKATAVVALPAPSEETKPADVDTKKDESTDNDDAEIDELRRRLEETEKAMEVIMNQLGSVSAKLSSSKLHSHLNNVEKELWASVESLDGAGSQSMASELTRSMAGWRSQLLANQLPSSYSLQLPTTTTTGSAAGVSESALQTAPPAPDELSLPSETGAELSEMADLIDGAEELQHDAQPVKMAAPGGLRRFASLEALCAAAGIQPVEEQVGRPLSPSAESVEPELVRPTWQKILTTRPDSGVGDAATHTIGIGDGQAAGQHYCTGVLPVEDEFVLEPSGSVSAGGRAPQDGGSIVRTPSERQSVVAASDELRAAEAAVLVSPACATTQSRVGLAAASPSRQAPAAPYREAPAASPLEAATSSRLIAAAPTSEPPAAPSREAAAAPPVSPRAAGGATSPTGVAGPTLVDATSASPTPVDPYRPPSRSVTVHYMRTHGPAQRRADSTRIQARIELQFGGGRDAVLATPARITAPPRHKRRGDTPLPANEDASEDTVHADCSCPQAEDAPGTSDCVIQDAEGDGGVKSKLPTQRQGKYTNTAVEEKASADEKATGLPLKRSSLAAIEAEVIPTAGVDKFDDTKVAKSDI